MSEKRATPSKRTTPEPGWPESPLSVVLAVAYVACAAIGVAGIYIATSTSDVPCRPGDCESQLQTPLGLGVVAIGIVLTILLALVQLVLRTVRELQQPA